ncbi:cupredoxin, Blue (type 1) copper protein, binding site [Artemisia annua]|uniref:Cupredoxin, Blue (Type 1) copper protein, binding site n=1 Tax=Artemisia annua TaxID=35608 RepID=A0A2U1LF58_ARTAN|nr:cupredoxin, Blue (type 1) copper protein, binding site [Artemisia annua]
MAGIKSMVVMVVMVLASFQLQSTLAQTRHVVGGSLGWTIPPNGAATYTTWAASQTFRVGDTLLFNFTTNAHNVLEVSQSAYGPCTVANPILTENNGPATINLTRAGNHYYICAFGTHCQAGQKVMVNVVGASGSTPPAATSPAPSGSTPMTPNTTMSPPPPSPSSASTLAAVVPVAFVAALALVF